MNVLLGCDVGQFESQAVRILAPIRLMQFHAMPLEFDRARLGPVLVIVEQPTLLPKAQKGTNEAKQIGVLLRQGPVKPTYLIVLTVGIVIAPLRPSYLITHDEHRLPSREQQNREEVAHLSLAQGFNLGIVCPPFHAAIPKEPT